MRSSGFFWCVPVCLALVTGACAKAHARAEPEMPQLETPPPPPRLVAPVQSEPLPTVAQPEEPAAQPRARTARPVTRTELKPPDQKAEADAKNEQPADPTQADGTPVSNSPQLRTLPAGDDMAMERSIRDLLQQASRDLNRVDYGALGDDAQAQYDTAKRFIQQAYDALKTKNLVFADNLADKAATLAAVLLGR